MNEIKNISDLTIKHLSVQYEPKQDCLIYHRVLQDGPGNNMYGLEVCKSLHLPKSFIDNAFKIRSIRYPEEKHIALQQQSQYNTKKIKSQKCEICCVNNSIDVHHLRFQSSSDDNGFIDHFHKNHLANLANVCKDCHDNIHKDNIEFRKTKTTKGTILREVIKK